MSDGRSSTLFDLRWVVIILLAVGSVSLPRYASQPISAAHAGGEGKSETSENKKKEEADKENQKEVENRTTGQPKAVTLIADFLGLDRGPNVNASWTTIDSITYAV